MSTTNSGTNAAQDSSAPAPADDRALFEAQSALDDYRPIRRNSETGNYTSVVVATCWDIWQARAAHQAAPAQPSAAEKEEFLALHRLLAAEKLRADQGWQRAEAKSRECIELREQFAAAAPACQVRNEALEEAIKVCEDERIPEEQGFELSDGDKDYNMAIKHCTDAIRSAIATPASNGNSEGEKA